LWAFIDCGAAEARAAAASSSGVDEAKHHIPIYTVSRKKNAELDSFDMSMRRLLLLFGSKLGFSRILDSFYAARFGGVHAFGYNSTETEPIWMKFGALWVHFGGLAQILCVIRPEVTAGEPGEILQRTISPISHRPHFTKFDRWNGENFQNRILKILP